MFGITETKTPCPNSRSDERGARSLGVSPDVAEMRIGVRRSVFVAHGSYLSKDGNQRCDFRAEVARADGCKKNCRGHEKTYAPSKDRQRRNSDEFVRDRNYWEWDFAGGAGGLLKGLHEFLAFGGIPKRLCRRSSPCPHANR
jgi:hypothetical protein